MSSEIIGNLKNTIFSKNNTSNIYMGLINRHKLKLNNNSKSTLTNRIVLEMKNSFSLIKVERVNSNNFNQIVTGVNKKVVANMTKFLSDPRNIANMNGKRNRFHQIWY